MTIKFLHHGQTRTLGKHSKVRSALKHGRMTAAEAARQPWYLKLTIEGRERAFKLTHLAKDKVIAEARDFLNTRLAQPNAFAAFIAATEAKRTLTIGALAAEWRAAGLPFNSRRPRVQTAAAVLVYHLDRALPFWSTIPVATINHQTIERYADTRPAALRAADLELSCLSSLCQWAVSAGRIAANPFAKRPRFSTVKQHCYVVSPENDETIHRLAGWLFETPVHNRRSPVNQNVLIGGWLLFSALTGLRCGERKFLQRLAPLAAEPERVKLLPPGSLYPDRTGKLVLKVQRIKRGQNPFVSVHPAMESFLSAWRAWLARALPEATLLFPLPTDDTTVVNRTLDMASAALELPHFSAHGFGRAYYVRVRRSQGANDATIAAELGQSSEGDLIRNTYGDPDDRLGGQMHDWLPASGPCAWDLLSQIKPAYKPFVRPDRHPEDTSGDTFGHGEDTGKMQQDTEPQTAENLVTESISRLSVPRVNIGESEISPMFNRGN